MKWQLSTCVLVTQAARLSQADAPVDVPSFANHGDDWSGTCRSRDLASPVDIDGPARTSPPTQDPFQFSYAAAGRVELTNNGRAIEAALPGLGGVYHPGGGWHDLREVRLRADAEHTVAGHRALLEVQLVHEHPDTGGLLIASVLFDPPAGASFNRSEDVLVNYTAPVDGDASPFLEPLLASRPPRLGEIVEANVTDGQLDLNALMDGSFVEYAGGDTLPPCQGALWMVRTAPMTAGVGQLMRLGQASRDLSAGFGNFRWAMPLNQRIFAVRRGLREHGKVGAAPAVGAPFKDGPAYGPYRAYAPPVVFKGDQVAQDALTIEKYVADYAHDLDHRMQAAALARVAALAPTTAPPPPPAGTPPPGEVSAVMRQLSAAGRQLDGLVKQALSSPEVVLPARNLVKELAKSYTRQAATDAVNQTAMAKPNPELMHAALRGMR